MIDQHSTTGPFRATSPLVYGEPCLVCDSPILRGDMLAIVRTGSDDDGRVHVARVVPIHWDCRPGTERFEAACAAVRMMLGDDGQELDE